MNRRQAIAAIGAGGGVALVGGASALEPAAPALKVSVVIPELYNAEGKLAFARTLRNAGYGFRFFVVIENVSKEDVYVWAEGNSAGHGTLSFEIVADGVKSVARRVEQEWSKNVLRAVRLAPGEQHVRAIDHDPLPDKAPQWEGFPFGAKGARREVTLRAVFEQPNEAQPNKKLAVWSGRVESPAMKVVLENQ